MSRDENRTENRTENESDHGDETALGSSGLGREAKIGVGVIALLLVVFGGVLAWRMMAPGEEGKVAVAPEPAKAKPAHESKTEMMLKDTKSKMFGGSAATLVPANSEATQPPKTGESVSKRWKMPPDRDHGKRAGSSTAMSAPPLMPDPPKAPVANPEDRYGREASDVRAHHNRGNNTGFGTPGDEPPARFARGQGEDSSGFAAAEPAPALPTYRDRDDRRFDNAAPSRLRPDSRRAVGEDRFAPVAPVGQYGANDYRREAADSRHNGFASRRVAPASRSPAPQRNDGKYEVQPNDSYWTISEQVYGSGAYFKALAEHNRGNGKSEDQLQPGDLILAPPLADLEKSYPDLCPKASRREALESRSLASTVSTRHAGRTYTVAEGDTLFNIARYELGKASRWVEIYELNRDVLGKDFNYLTPGIQLAMPSGEKPDVVAQPPSSTFRR